MNSTTLPGILIKTMYLGPLNFKRSRTGFSIGQDKSYHYLAF